MPFQPSGVLMRTLFLLLQAGLSLQQYVLPASTLPPTPQLPPAKSSGYVNLTSEVAIFYYQFGPPLDECKKKGNTPIFFLHGGFGNAHYFGHQISFLLDSWTAAADTTIFAIDTRGQGRSTGLDQPFSYDIFTQDLEGVLDHFQIPKINIVGWSDGAIIGYDLAINKPEKLDRLFAFAGQYSYENTNSSLANATTFNDYLARAAIEYAQLSPQGTQFAALETKLTNTFAVLPNYTQSDFAKIPTLFQDCKDAPFIWVVDAADEEVVNRDVPTTLHNWIPASGEAILPSVGHFAFLEDPATFNVYMARFFDYTVNCTTFLRKPTSPPGFFSWPFVFPF